MKPRTKSAAIEPGSTPRPLAPGTILLLSEDQELYKSLRSFGKERGWIIVRASGGPSSGEVTQVLRPATILLDLDLKRDNAWNTAEALLARPNCPPLILITGQGQQFDVRTAIRAGSIVHKSAGALGLFERLRESLALPKNLQRDRNVEQRVLIRWLRPRSWSVAAAPQRLELSVQGLAR